MKKILVMSLMVLLFVSNPIHATEPLEISVEVEIKDCDELDNYNQIYIDLLVEPYDEEEVELKEGYMAEEAFYDIEVEGFYSYTAYNLNEGFYPDVNRYECSLKMGVSLNRDDDFYLIIYNSDGTIYHNEKHSFGDVSYSQGYKYYRWFTYDVEEDVLDIERERHYSIMESFVILAISILVMFVGTTILNVLTQKWCLKKYFEGLNLQKYKLLNIVFSIVYAILITMSVIRFRWIPIFLVIILMYLLSVVLYTRINEKEAIHRTMGKLLIVQLIPLGLNLAILIGVSVFWIYRIL